MYYRNLSQNLFVRGFTQPSKTTGLTKPSLAGFTLIELLIVIAIIGVLSSVVLASLQTAREKGTNVSIESSIGGLRSAGEIYFSDASNTYEVDNDTDSVCITDDLAAHKGILRMLVAADAANGVGAVVCNDDPSSWAAAAQLIGSDSGNYFCADSTGFAGVKTGVVGAGGDFDTNLSCPSI